MDFNEIKNKNVHKTKYKKKNPNKQKNKHGKKYKNEQNCNSEHLSHSEHANLKNLFYNDNGINSICDDYTETNEVINHLLFNVKNNKNLSLKSEELVSCVLKINEYRTYINSYITRFIRHNDITNIMSMIKIKNKHISVNDISKTYKLSKSIINNFYKLESSEKEEKLLKNDNNIQQIIALFVYINYKLVIGELNF